MPLPIRRGLDNGAGVMFGRADECQLLTQAYHRSSRSGNLTFRSNSSTFSAQELVLIEGHSGTGKTTLAHSIVDKVTQDDRGFFLTGKFELGVVQKPYEIFVNAFQKFPEALKASETFHSPDDARHDKICEAIRKAVGSEGKILTGMIPSLADLIGEQEDHDAYSVQGKDALHRFQFLFSNFVRAVSEVVPLVLFFDDLQWSDPASLSLLQVILESQPNQNKPSSLFVICAFRDEDPFTQTSSPESKRPASTHFQSFLERMSHSSLINLTKIVLHNLDEATTCRLIDEYLDVSSDVTQKLAALIFAKSQGNPFHVSQLLGPLLNYTTLSSESGSQQQKDWNEEEFFETTEAIGTVDDLIRQKMTSLPPLAQQVLQAAACMGDCIDHPALCTVFDGNVAGVEAALKASLSDGFLVYEPKLGEYRFAHDRFRQVSLSMIDNVKSASYHIGHQLWTKATPLFLNTKMFIVTNLLNNGTKLMTDKMERYGAAALNLEAGLKAISLAAFPDACRFLQAGIGFLAGGDHWKEEYTLSLSLFSVGADAELCMQNFTRVHELVEQVLENARTVRDKLRAYVALINSLGQRGNIDAALQVGIEVSRQLVDPLPPKVTNASILVEIIKTKIALRGRSNIALLTLPPLQDEDKIASMYILTNLVTYTFQAASNYCPVIGARIVRMCLKHGTHKWCALGFATFGFVLCSLDRKEGYKLGTLALTMIERYRGKELLPRVHMYFYSLIHHWRQPLEASLKPLQNASKIGMEMGDVENALIAYTFYASHCLYHGKPLQQVENMFNEAVRQALLFRQDNMVNATLPLQQYIHNLTGRAPVPKILAGEIMPLFEVASEGDSLLIPYCNYCLGTELAFMFGDLDLAYQMLEKKRSVPFEPVTFFYYSKICLKEALICIALARDRAQSRRTNLKTAKVMLKQLRAWAKDCPQNFQHSQRLVEAELLSRGISSRSSMKQVRLVRERYDQAIDGAIKTGFVEEAALACEMAGDFMNRCNDHEHARNYWSEARTWYLEWGATEKATQVSRSRNSGVVL